MTFSEAAFLVSLPLTLLSVEVTGSVVSEIIEVISETSLELRV